MKPVALHTPVSPYVSSVYNALCTVVQAAPLGALFWMMWHKPVEKIPCPPQDVQKVDCIKIGPSFIDEFTDAVRIDLNQLQMGQGYNFTFTFRDDLLIIYVKISLILAIVGLIWHRYVVTDQFVAWRLSVFDTFFLFLFGTWETCLALSMRGSTLMFALWLSLLLLTAMITYGYLTFKLTRTETAKRRQTPLALYKEHFGTEEGGAVYCAVKAYFIESLYIVLISLTIMIGITVYSSIRKIDFFIVAAITLAIILALFKDRITFRLLKIGASTTPASQHPG
jgi:hypothetical protein